MLIGQRLRALREQRGLSQGDVEKKTGLIRVYISRAELGIVVPTIATLEKFADALDIPLYQIFYESKNTSEAVTAKRTQNGFGSSVRDSRALEAFRKAIGELTPKDRALLLGIALKMAKRNRTPVRRKKNL
jgi:transcriptional regulator with XRE-family HTH domain